MVKIALGVHENLNYLGLKKQYGKKMFEINKRKPFKKCDD